MRIGFVSIYSWRPHVEHLYYLANLMEQAGHSIEFLTCDGDLPTCYTKELRDLRPAWRECIQCRSGGVRSYASGNVTSLGEMTNGQSCLSEHRLEWAQSSASTLGRFESDEEYATPQFHRLVQHLAPIIDLSHEAACKWIDECEIEALVVFNGRIDATRAIFESAIKKNIPVVSLERTWFGDGLQLLPQENCLGLKSVDRIVQEWAERPLTHQQAMYAARLIASRFLKKNMNEWRAYNTNATHASWPTKGKRKLLLIPGSRNEIWGHEDWSSGWAHPIEGYDALIQHLQLESDELVLRCHPNWGEKIGKMGGELPEKYYTDWANHRGITVIQSTSTVSTLELIMQADAIVIASGSAALEAGALGKQVISLAAANYQAAGIRDNARNPDELKKLVLWGNLIDAEVKLRADDVRRKTLRFAYAIAYRAPQFVDYVKCDTPTRYFYKAGANPEQLIDLFQSGNLKADDSQFAESENEESQILDLMCKKEWGKLFFDVPVSTEYKRIKRRFPYMAIDYLRNWMRHGDR